MKRTFMSVTLLVLASLSLPGASDESRSENPDARSFLESVWAQLGAEEIRCATLGRGELPVPAGAFRCGLLDEGSVYSIVHDEAFGLAEQGVPLLNLETWTLPPNQLVRSPALAALPEVPGYEAVGYLIDTSRVGVWTAAGLPAVHPCRVVVLTLEEVGPFPEFMPVVEAPR